MRQTTLWTEALRSIWASRIASLLVAIVAGAICFGALTTVGKTAADSHELAQRLEDGGARVLTVIDTEHEGIINQRTTTSIRSLSGVSVVAAVQAPVDAANGVIGLGGTRIPLWVAIDPQSADACVTLTQGRPPRPGEALVSETTLPTLGMTTAAGWLVTTDGQYPVVGAMRPSSLCPDMTAGAIAISRQRDAVGGQLQVQLASVDPEGTGVSEVIGILGPKRPDKLVIDSPNELAKTARQLQQDLAASGRSHLLLLLAMGAGVVAAVVFSDVIIHRRDLGRRRTLGITRSNLIQLVCLRATITALAGSTLGALSGVISSRLAGHPVPWDYAAAVVILVMIATIIAALGPAIYAAHRDPVRVMRTP